ncbi:hypothetical protein LIER_30800 [Lithospermum erythrorhizon]|uniref:Uncharacterized protein n=1 Tax=Lithospermum erythrorhizon TaxID=34254 RepID=A0AAV3RSK5_LITER
MMDQLEGILTLYKKEDLKARKQHNFNKEKHKLWKKKSIFYELPYWETNTIQHNLDMMHIVKNFSGNILWTILGCPMRSKDNMMARRDLEMLNIRKPLHPISLPSGRWSLPPASYTMSSVDKDYFCRMLKKVRPPDGYSSNISSKVRMEGITLKVFEECMHFCERYLKDVDTKLNREPRNDDGESTIRRPFGQCTLKQLDRRTWNQAHKWVLDNYESLEQYKK